MALQLNITTRDTVNHPEAYFKITHTNIDWLNKEANITIQIWHDADARDGDHPAGTVGGFTLNFEKTTAEELPAFSNLFSIENLDNPGVNTIGIIYDWLKLQSNLRGFDFTKAIEI